MARIPSLLAACAVLVSAAAAHAQSPRITKSGDPSVKPDSIYGLAVDPKTVPDQDAYFLLDDGIVRIEADGRGTRTYRQIVQILTPGAVERYQEHSFTSTPGTEKLMINWFRVVRPDGTVISEAPTMVQDSDIPASTENPVYGDSKVRRLSLTGVAPGTIIDYSWTTEELKPALPGDFYASWSVSTALGVRRSRYIVDVPATLKVHLDERNLNFARRDQSVGGRRIMTWATADLPRHEGEAFAADSNGVTMSVAVATLPTWEGIAAWYARNAAGRYTLAPALRQQVAGLVAGARTRLDTVRAVHRWVAQDVRYVSISLGRGGYVPRAPEEVLRTGYGDCKDKATLFVAALRHLGVEAYPVLLNSGGGVERGLPTISQLNHAIAAVKGADGWEYTDLTAKLTPYGELPWGPQGEFGLIVRDDGAGEVVTLPMAPIPHNRSLSRVTGSLDAQGIFSGDWEIATSGTAAEGLRSAFENPIDSAARANAANALARRMFEDAEGRDLEGFEGRDLRAAPRMKVHIVRAKAASQSGGMTLFHLPIGSMGGLANSASELLKKPRRFPIDVRGVMGNGEDITELRVTLPAGWKARLPQGVVATSVFGTYESTYAQEGRDLVVRRRTMGARGVLPPEKVTELADWFRTLAKDDAKFILLEPGPSTSDAR
jgi:transglutaminase-like putative cysteine protease